MTQPVQADSVGVLMAREAAGSLGTQPTSGFVQMQPNPAGIQALQRANIGVERHILSPNLTTENGEIVGYDVKPKLVMDVTKDVVDNWVEPTFRSSLKHSGGTGLSKFYPSAVVNGSPSSWTVAADGAFASGILVRGNGFTNAANNGLHVVTSGSTSTSIKTADSLVAETPPPNAALFVAGVQGASGDIELNASGNLTSTVLDFTTLGLNVGQKIYVGDPTSGAAYAFATAAYTGEAVISAIAAHQLTLILQAWTVGSADTGTGKTIRLLFQAMAQNVPFDPTGANGYLMAPSVSLELSELGSGGSTDYTYVNGAAPDQVQLEFPLEGKVTATIDMVGMVVQEPTTTRATGASSYLSPLQTDMFTTGANMYDFRLLNQSTAARISMECNKLTLTVKNNVKPQKQLATAGAAGLIFGEYTLSGSMDAYMLDNTLTKAIDANTSATLNTLCKSADGGFGFYFPMVKIRKGDKTYQAGNAVMQNCDLVMNRDPTTGIAWSCSLFSYLP